MNDLVEATFDDGSPIEEIAIYDGQQRMSARVLPLRDQGVCSLFRGERNNTLAGYSEVFLALFEIPESAYFDAKSERFSSKVADMGDFAYLKAYGVPSLDAEITEGNTYDTLTMFVLGERPIRGIDNYHRFYANRNGLGSLEPAFEEAKLAAISQLGLTPETARGLQAKVHTHWGYGGIIPSYIPRDEITQTPQSQEQAWLAGITCPSVTFEYLRPDGSSTKLFTEVLLANKLDSRMVQTYIAEHPKTLISFGDAVSLLGR